MREVAGTLRGVVTGDPLLLGFQTESHVFIEARAFAWTAAMLASTKPALVIKSEQWKPSPTAIG